MESRRLFSSFVGILTIAGLMPGSPISPLFLSSWLLLASAMGAMSALMAGILNFCPIRSAVFRLVGPISGSFCGIASAEKS